MPSTSHRDRHDRHDVAVGRQIPTKTAIAVFRTALAANRMIRARCAKPAWVEDDRVDSFIVGHK